MTHAVPDARLIELAAKDSPPTDLVPYLARLGAGGARKVAFLEEFVGSPDVVWAEGRGVQVVVDVDLEVDKAPIAVALEEVATSIQKFDRMRRLLLAISDMELAEHAAEALVDANERDGAARLFERVLETGLVVTFTRPYLDSNDAGLHRRFHPSDAEDRELLEYVEHLRDDYHAHAGHTQRRYIIDTQSLLGLERGEPRYTETWETLGVERLRDIADLARRQAEKLKLAASKVEDELPDK